MLNLEHPDTARDWEALKAIKTGGTQAASTAAMNAMLQALNAGKSKEEANEIFSNTYIQVLHGK